MADRRGVLSLVARQPLLDPAGVVRAYELLFRGAPDVDGTLGDGRRATAQVLVSTFLDLGVQEVAAGLPAWVNVSREFLLDVDPLPLPPDGVVLELLEDQEVDDALLARLRALREQGFRVALDDFVPTPEAEPLLALATYVKLDVQALGLDGFARHAPALARRGLVVVAEKVETEAERAACVRHGAQLLQGWFHRRAEQLPDRRVPSAPLGRLRVAVDVDFEALQRAVLSDPGLSVRLLRVLNSASFGLRHRVASVRQALVLLGADTVRQWALVLALSELGRPGPPALATGLVRGRLCEQLARLRGGADAAAAFTVGLLSVLDLLLHQPLERALAELPLAGPLRDALLRREGPLGALLDAALRIEAGDGANCAQESEVLRGALAWADAVLRDVAEG